MSSLSDITGMSYRFAVKWSIPVQKFVNMPPFGESHTLWSNRYQIENMDNLIFSYRLTCGANYTQMNVVNDFHIPLVLEDALILIKDCIYRVRCNSTNTLGRLVFDRDVLAQNLSEDDKVTIHCIMSIPVQVKAVSNSYAPPKTAYSEEEKHKVDNVEFEISVTNVFLDPHGYDAVNEFVYSGRIPDFNVKMAISMMSQAHKRQNPMLKALCVEYLMENITTENVTEVLNQSLESEAKDLSKKCVDFLSERCKIVSIQ